jgi:hypothetical protein
MKTGYSYCALSIYGMLPHHGLCSTFYCEKNPIILRINGADARLGRRGMSMLFLLPCIRKKLKHD